jgi:hypothetical protein
MTYDPNQAVPHRPVVSTTEARAGVTGQVSALSLFLDFWELLLRSVLSFSDSLTHNFDARGMHL